MQGFRSTTTTRKQATDADKQRAAELKQRTNGRPYSKETWAHEFRKLRELDGVEDAKLAKVFAWYIQNFRASKYIPIALTAKEFRLKFIKIDAAMERDVGDTTLEDIEPSDDAKQLHKQLRMKRWPKGSEKDLLGAIDSSLRNYTDFRQRLVKLGKVLVASSREARTVQHLLKSKLDAPNFFINQWFSSVFDSVVNWKEWSGELKTFIWRHDSKRFVKIVRGWCAEYNKDIWKDIVECLYDEG